MSEAIAQKLDEARALIEGPGCWGQGRSKRTLPLNDRYCATGAIHHVVTGHAFQCSPEAAAVEAALEAVVGRAPTQWNDDPERTQAEVIEAFRKAAELARAEA